MTQLTMVAVKPALLSKINWVQVISVLLTCAAAFGLPITEEQRVALLALIGVVGPIITGYIKTYLTTTITPASAKLL